MFSKGAMNIRGAASVGLPSFCVGSIQAVVESRVADEENQLPNRRWPLVELKDRLPSSRAVMKKLEPRSEGVDKLC